MKEFKGPKKQAGIWPALIAAGASLAGGLIARSGQQSTNKDSEREAQRNRDFQERMSNTAIRRRMKDMRAGGINPILAATYDATTPPGAMANFGNPGAAFTTGVQQVGTTGLGIAKATQEIMQLKSRTGLNDEQANVISLMGNLSSKASEGWDGIFNYLEGNTGEIMQYLNSIPGEIRSEASDILSELKQVIQARQDDQREFVEGWLDDMSAQFQQAWKDMKIFLQFQQLPSKPDL